MLRLHFTYADLAKVVLNAAPRPMCEAVLSLQVLSHTDQPFRFGPWRSTLRGRIPDAARPLTELVPARGWIPDFLTPVVDGPGSDDESLDAVRSTSVRQIRADLKRLGAAGRLPGWAPALADGQAGPMAALTGALAAWNRVAVAPHGVRIREAFDAEVIRKRTIMAGSGVDAVLSGLHPAVTWQPPVLTVPSSRDADIDLGGRGLLLAPMVFCGPLPRLRLGDDAGNRAALAYQVPFDPVEANPLTAAEPDRTVRRASALDRLMGGTRSTVLRAVVVSPGLTTSELAHRADVALATASEHATVLRDAGLIASHRDGSRVRHFPTAAAAALLGSSV